MISAGLRENWSPITRQGKVRTRDYLASAARDWWITTDTGVVSGGTTANNAAATRHQLTLTEDDCLSAAVPALRDEKVHGLGAR